jgi:peroxiredoxin
MRRPLSLTVLLTAFYLAVASGDLRADANERPAIGTEVKDFTFTDIRYLPRTLSDFGDREAFVLVFTTLDCPIVKRSLPKLRTLDEDYRDQGVQFVVVNVGPSDTVVDIANQAVQANLGFPFAKDFTGEVVAAVGATRTPECVVIDSQRRLRYRGRIDSEFRLGGVRPDPGRQDLREAIDDVLAERDVRVTATPVDGCLITEPRQPQKRDLTYYRDVAPLMKKHCQQCHQADSAAPFSLLTLADVDTHSAMIAEVVTQRRMPPWHAASEQGHFANNLSLSGNDIATIVDWAKGDRIAGDPVDAPPPIAPRDSEWRIGEPDLIVRLPAPQKIPAEGYIPYRYAVLPHVFLRDTWVQKVEINPGNDAVVHHCNMGFASVKDLGSEGFQAEKNFVTGFVPGGDPMVLDSGIGFCIPAGSVVGLQIHYVTTGEETTDQTAVGFVFAKETIQKQLRHFQCHTSKIAIPPGASHHEVKAKRTFEHDATGLGMFCHMHLRGKDMTFVANFPDGRRETLLAVSNYNFEWQSSYRWPVDAAKFPKGTGIDCTAHYDNSAFNPYNPDPTATVREGAQTYQEMMYGFLFFTHDDEALNLKINPQTGLVVK